MTIITIIREAKCKDCQHISLLHYGKRKRFICDKGHSLCKGKESKICQDSYEYRIEYHIKDVRNEKD
jgi:hypothetical protein